jgi:hypothetical protein
MPYKFAVGQVVEYKPTGAKVGLFRVIRQMPEELQAIDRKYRIKSEHEGFERNVLECDLTASDRDEHEYASPKPLRRVGGH